MKEMIMDRFLPRPPVALVVGCDEKERAMAKVLLEESELAVIECDTAKAARQAIDQTARSPLAVAFVNIGPSGEMDGMALAQVVKQERPEVQVIVTSVSLDRRVDDLPEGAICMAKPWLPLELLVHAGRARSNVSA